MQNKFATYTDGNGGRAILLFLLFSVAIYQFVSVGIGPIAMICLSPLVIAAIYIAFRWRTATFWLLFFLNYLLHWFNTNGWLPGGIPLSFYNEALEIVLLAIAIIDARKSPCFERTGNMMLYALMIWCGFAPWKFSMIPVILASMFMLGTLVPASWLSRFSMHS